MQHNGVLSGSGAIVAPSRRPGLQAITPAVWKSALTLALGPIVSAMIGTILLDEFVNRPDAASITTLVPGYVYASATIMKACLVAGAAMPLAALFSRREDAPASNEELPILGIISIGVMIIIPLIGAVLVLVAQSLAEGGPLSGNFPIFSQAAVIVQLLTIIIAGGTAVTAFARRERPRLLPAFTLIVAIVLVALFVHFRFYALGFHQDTWAPA